MTARHEEAVRLMSDEGLSAAKAGARVGLSRNAVLGFKYRSVTPREKIKAYAEKCYQDRYPKKPVLPELTLQQVKYQGDWAILRADGYSYRAIARLAQCSPEWVRQVVKANPDRRVKAVFHFEPSQEFLWCDVLEIARTKEPTS